MEIGCGTGHLLSHVITASPHLEISGGDVLEAGLRYAAVRVPTVTFYQIDARQIGSQARKDFIARQPMGRLGTVEDMAGIMLYLASDESLFATGQIFSIDGGMTI